MQPTIKTARIAGLFYLLMAISAGVAGFARTSVIVQGDAAATAERIRASETLFRVGIFADLVQATAFLLTAIALYALLQHVNRLTATAIVALVAVSATIQSLNLVTEFAALSAATGSSLGTAFGATGADEMAAFFMQLQHDGFVLAQMTFGLWLLPLASLVIGSGLFPRVLGYVLAVAGVLYLVDLTAYIVAPALEPTTLPFAALAGIVGELSFMGWLLVKGIRTPRSTVVPAIPGSPGWAVGA